jgi:hypothetical protein
MDMGNCEITAVKPGGLADRAGLLVGDVIVELDGMAPVAFLASAWWPRDVKPVLVRVERDGRRLWRVLEFDVEAELAVTQPAAPIAAADSAPVAPADPFKDMFLRPPAPAADSRVDDGDDRAVAAAIRQRVAALEAKVQRVGIPKPKPFDPKPGDLTEEVAWPRSEYGAASEV